MSLLQSKRNPFLHDPVVQCLFDYLSLKDIKSFRFVCTTWNFVSEPFLRKRGKVVFGGSLTPASFIEYSESRLPAVPFTSFKFTNARTHPNSDWTVSEIQSFLAVYGTNIKSLEFDNLIIFANEPHGGSMEISRSIEMNELMDLAPNIVDLKIVGNILTSYVVSAYKLVSVKNLYLKYCTLNLISTQDRITPLKIYLHKMKFQVNGVDVDDVSLHDFIDFSQCTEIECHPLTKTTPMKFDISNIVTVTKLDINCSRLLNWSTSRAKIDHLIIRNHFMENADTEIQIKKMTLCQSKDFMGLPKTIEELTLEDGLDYSYDEIIDLPNLKHLTLMALCSKSTRDDFLGLSFFKNCSKLSNLILEALPRPYLYLSSNPPRHPCKFKISWIPPSVKRIKFIAIQRFSIVLNAVIDVDILELDIDKISNAVILINKIRPKVLVCSAIRRIHCDDFIEFVQNYKQIIQRIFLGFHNRENVALYDSEDHEFPKSNLGIHVDKEACTYEFENGRGKAISEEQFENVRKWC